MQKPWRKVQNMNCDKKDLLLYAVTDRAWLRGETLYGQVEKALKGGATFMQLRKRTWMRNIFSRRQWKSKSFAKSTMYHL